MKIKIQTYTYLDAILADPILPLPKEMQKYQIGKMWEGVKSLSQSQLPTYADWSVVSDSLNLMETLIEMGHAEDSQGAINDAMAALIRLGNSHTSGKPMRLAEPDLTIICGMLEDYEFMLANLSARVMITCHRRTEKRIKEIFAGKSKKHDVKVV